MVAACKGPPTPTTTEASPGVSPTTSTTSAAVAHGTWDDEVVYAIMIDRFSRDGAVVDADPAHPLKFWGGNINGVRKKLDYIQSLGATTVLLTPITSSASYHGYDVANLTTVNKRFGTLEDYRELIAECHKRKMKILFDFVANHTHPAATLRKDHPDWYRAGPRRPPAINDVIFNEKWAKTEFYGLADLDTEKEEVYQYLLAAARLWVGQGIDGFRMDAVTLIAPTFWHRFNADIRKLAPPDFFILGEIFTTDLDQLAEHEDAFDGYFDFDFQEAIPWNLTTEGHSAMLSRVVRSRLKESGRRSMPFRFIDNHDVSRFHVDLPGPSDERTNVDRTRLALTQTMIAPGVPTILYGSEALLSNLVLPPEVKFDKARSAMSFDAKPELALTLQKLSAFRKRFHVNQARVRWLANGPNFAPLEFVYLENPTTHARAFVALNSSNMPRAFGFDLSMFPGWPKAGTLKDAVTGEELAFAEGRLEAALLAYGSKVLELVP